MLNFLLSLQVYLVPSLKNLYLKIICKSNFYFNVLNKPLPLFYSYLQILLKGNFIETTIYNIFGILTCHSITLLKVWYPIIQIFKLQIPNSKMHSFPILKYIFLNKWSLCQYNRRSPWEIMTTRKTTEITNHLALGWVFLAQV